ncbi:MAG: hypothetical protein ACYCSW_05990 [bacterium]
MKKPWSITTTLRNPERLRNFLIALKELENSKWTLENQIKYQIFLLKKGFTDTVVINFIMYYRKSRLI